MSIRIGEVAERVGFAASAIRYYEEMGLLGEVQRESGRRTFDESVIQRLNLIRLLVDSGFSLDEARLLVSDRSPGRVKSRELGRRKLSEIEASMQRLAATKAVVEWGLRCQCSSFDECTCALHEVLPTSDIAEQPNV